jgi:phosphoglycolate phosphatase-like HAD superfamily hydrolase
MWHTGARMPDKPQVSLLITDLDNTLFDWVDMWHAAFSALLEKTADISGLPVAQLESEFKAIHQRHGTTEYAFSLEELPSLRRQHAGGDIRQLYADAVEAYRSARAAHLQLFPGVLDALTEIKRRGCLIVGYTESMTFYSAYRIRHLDLDVLIDLLYSPPDAQLPPHMTPEQVARYPKEKYSPRQTRLRQTPAGEKKPNPRLLLDIVCDVGGTREHTVYVGDSQIKDIAMAQDAGVTEVWAKYGVAQNREQYGLLRRVTHWTDQEVARERELAEQLISKGRGLNPRYTLEHGFSELLGLFDFVAFEAAVSSEKRALL